MTASPTIDARPDGSTVEPHASRRADAPDVLIQRVTKRFDAVIAVDGMDLSIERGAFYSLLGPSGCGKTTTLRMIAGFEQPTEGEIFLAGQPIAGVPPYQRNVNTVFQHYALFPHMDVNQNVGYGLRQRKVDRKEEDRRVAEALDMVRLTGYGKRRTWEMSGGQQQRVALARALVNRPTVLLLDEPLGALDLKLRKEMQLELKALQREVGITFVYVTHDQEEALTMSDVIVVMRDGRIHQSGSPETLYQRPADRFVAGFVGVSNFIEARALDRAGPGELVRVDLGGGIVTTGRSTTDDAAVDAGSTVTIAVRPESITVEPARIDAAATPSGRAASIPGRVRQGTYLGDQTEYRIDTDAIGEVIVRRQNAGSDTTAARFAPGDGVTIGWHEEANLVLLS